MVSLNFNGCFMSRNLNIFPSIVFIITVPQSNFGSKLSMETDMNRDRSMLSAIFPKKLAFS